MAQCHITWIISGYGTRNSHCTNENVNRSVASSTSEQVHELNYSGRGGEMIYCNFLTEIVMNLLLLTIGRISI
jgi:hypothetical protein